MRGSSPRHSEQSSMEHTLDQPTTASDTTPSTPFTNDTLTTEDIPDLVQQVRGALSEDRHPLQLSLSHLTNPRQVSHLLHYYVVS